MAESYVISVVLEGNSSSMTNATKKASKSQKELTQSTQAANIAFLAQVARYQAMTAALNQTIGGFNKMAGALDKLGFKEQGAAIRKYTAYLELVAGPAEIYLAYLTLSIAMGMKDAQTKNAQAAATTNAAAAQTGLNVAMKANPLFAIITVVLMLVAALTLLEMKFGAITKVIDGLRNAVDRLIDSWKSLSDLGNMGIPGGGGDSFSSLSNLKSLGGSKS